MGKGGNRRTGVGGAGRAGRGGWVGGGKFTQ